MVDKALFSSDSDEWHTPKWLFNELNQILHFNLDAAATPENALTETYFTKETDGLVQSWQDRRTWCNPPYSQVGAWMKKAWREFAEPQQTYCAKGGCVMLAPARTDTVWFHDWVLDNAVMLIFIRGRLKFSESKNSAPFPSCLVVYGFNETTRWSIGQWAKHHDRMMSTKHFSNWLEQN